jgi:hypothetical protein
VSLLVRQLGLGFVMAQNWEWMNVIRWFKNMPVSNQIFIGLELIRRSDIFAAPNLQSVNYSRNKTLNHLKTCTLGFTEKGLVANLF